ncbi:MAG: YebC/PmpR family DNA-binding transcriptional regulator [Spirochaetes bacterium]|jgi:YebC/PmpR family DNA-binding regulatory protein|nr:YebC/PmpR family DNA-binding transcriptional regulator [Spirochaetota bacterium]
MSGHSKWATIKRKKASVDSKRGALFTKIIREITVAARMGGEDINSNPRLRTAILKARENNMPADNIERAIKKGTGTLEGVVYEEITYEGYGPGGVAIMAHCLTDNKKRTTPEIRTLFSRNGGNLGETGCVSYMFDRKGMVIIEGGQASEEEIMELVLDYGVDDVRTEDGNIVIVTSPEGFAQVNDLVQAKQYRLALHEITFIPQSTILLDEKKAEQCLRLIEQLEEQDDVQNVYSNYEIPDAIMTRIGEGR